MLAFFLSSHFWKKKKKVYVKLHFPDEKDLEVMLSHAYLAPQAH